MERRGSRMWDRGDVTDVADALRGKPVKRRGESVQVELHDPWHGLEVLGRDGVWRGVGKIQREVPIELARFREGPTDA